MSYGGPRKDKEVRQSHAVQRAWERHGLDLTSQDLRRMLGDIRANAAIYAGEGFNGAQYYDVLHHGRLLRVIYDPKTRYIVTVLPPGAIARDATLR